MDQLNEDHTYRPQGTNHSSPINNPSLPLGTGQQASILQVGGQSFLILTAGQAASSLQGLELNLLPVGSPDPSFPQTSEPQAQILQVGGVHPGVREIDGHKPLRNQTESVPPNLVQIHGVQPPAVQLDPGAQLQIIQAFEPSQCIIPGATTAQVGGLLSSSAKAGTRAAPNIRDKPVVEDFQSGLTKVDGDVPLLSHAERAQPNIAKISGPVSSSVQMGSLVKAETEPLPINKIAVHSAHAFHPALSQSPGPRPPFSQTKRFRPSVLRRNWSSPSHIPTQTEFSYVKIKTEPGLGDAEIKPLTSEASGNYAETGKLVYFSTPPSQSSQLNPSLGDSCELQPSAVQESAKHSTLTKETKQSMTKKGLKTQQDHTQTTDDALSAYNLIKLMHAYTNISKKIKSIGTQAKMLLKSRSQAVQFPENSFESPTYQECGTQSEESYWPEQADFQESSKPPPYKVVIVRDPEPASVSLFFSETSREDRDHAWNMEEVEKRIHGSIEVEHPHFDDVAVYFTEDEWACLNNAEKNLYRKVMMDNYWNLVAVGKISITPPLISKIERGQEPYTRSQQQTNYKQSSDFDSRDDPLSQKVSGQVYNVHSFSERLNQITYPIKLSMSGLTVTRIMSDSSFYDPSHAAQVEDSPRDPGEQCPFRSLLKEKPVINKNPFRCFKCERTFKSFESLIHHFQRMHKNENNLTCTECGKKFTKLKMLLLHFMMHTGDRPFVCSGCGKTFTSQVCLNYHYGLNAKKKLYECTECGQQFPLKHSLMKHEKLHREDPNNSCIVCGRKFSHKANLLLHEKTHGSHSFCPICGQYFSQREDCAQHMLEHSPSELFACAECGNAFIYERQLVEHQKLHQNKYIDLACPDIVVKVEEEG